MPAVKIARSEGRVIVTPNASMTTLASPTQGDFPSQSLWRVTMRAGQCGPVHSFDVEQVWHLLEGSASVAVDDQTIDLAAGDTVVIPSGARRQVSTGSGAVFVVCGPASGLATPLDPRGEPVAPAWIL